MTDRALRCARSCMIASALAVFAMGCDDRSSQLPEPPPFDGAVVEQWRAKHEADYRRDWVSIAGLHPLKPGPNSAGSAASNDIVLPPPVPAVIGRFVLDGTRVVFEPAANSPVKFKDQPVTSPVQLASGDQTTGELTIDQVRLIAHLSGDRRSIRVRDANSPQAKSFVGFAWFPIDPRYRVVGRFIKDATPQRLKVPNTLGDEDAYSTEGVVEFMLLGQTLKLRPFTTRPKRFYFVFRDASSGQETYETARFLYSDLLDDGTTLLDFNQAYNPPCAFNPFTTCPIPLRENRLPIKILAGEKAYAGQAK